MNGPIYTIEIALFRVERRRGRGKIESSRQHTFARATGLRLVRESSHFRFLVAFAVKSATTQLGSGTKARRIPGDGM